MCERVCERVCVSERAAWKKGHGPEELKNDIPETEAVFC